MSRLVAYDSESVILTIGGEVITDLTDDPFVTVTKRNDNFTEDEGADGGVVRNHTHSKLYDVTVGLLGGSSHNAFLDALATVDDSSTNGAGIVAFMLKDLNGSTLYTTDKIWIKKPADGVFGINRPPVSWELVAIFDPSKAIVGGNG